MYANKYLRIYLRDHHAASIAGCEIAKRTCKSNQGSSFAEVLAEISKEIDEDRRSLEWLMEQADVQPAKGKDAAAWGVEKLGRLKLNGRITTYSPLSRVFEFETIASGILAKRGLWVSLRHATLEEPEIDSRLQELIARADSQLHRMTSLRDRAAELAFTT